MKKTMLYRVDGGKVWGISMGHVRRAMIVSNILSRDYQIIFAMKNYPDGVAFVRNAGYQVETIEIADDSDGAIEKICETFQPERIIFDLNGTPYIRFFDFCREKGIRTIVFDVAGKCAGVPDILINDSIVKEFTRYPHIESRAKLAIGPEYFVIENPPDALPIKEKVDCVLITMGGSDPAGLTLKTLEALDGFERNFRLAAILGPGFTEQSLALDIAGKSKDIDIIENPPDFLNLLANSDVVITAAGRTLLECAYLGRPTILVPSIEHEAATAEEYCRLAGGFNTGLWDDQSTPEKIAKALNQYCGSRELRESVSLAAKRIVDGAGLKRAMELIME